MYSKSCLATLTFGESARTVNPDSSGLGTLRIDATTDGIAILFIVERAITIDQVGIMVNFKNGTPTYGVSLQGVDASGKPDGTDKTGTLADWAPTADDAIQWVTLGASYVASVGEKLCIRIQDGATGNDPSASHYIDVAQHSNQFGHDFLPYLLYTTNGGSSWSGISDRHPLFGYRNSGDTASAYGRPVYRPCTTSSQTCGSVNDIHAQKFKIPQSFGKRVKIFGIHIDRVWAQKEYEVGIFNSSGGTVVSAAVDDDHSTAAGTDLSDVVVYFADTWLDTNTTYYVGCKLTEAGVNGISMIVNKLTAADDRSAFVGYPDNNIAFYNGTSWSDINTEVAAGVSLLISDVDAGIKPAIQPIETGVVI